MFYERGANPDWDSDKAKLHFTQEVMQRRSVTELLGSYTILS